MNPYQPPLHDDGVAGSPRPPVIDPDTARAIADKIKRLNRNSLLLGACGLALQCSSRAAGGGRGGSLGSQTPLELLLQLAGIGVLVYAFSLYARMRNQSPWWGALGLLSCLGIVGLALLPKKCHSCNATTKGRLCQHCGAPAPL